MAAKIMYIDVDDNGNDTDTEESPVPVPVPVQIFIRMFPNTICYNGFSSNTVLDIKRYIRDRYNIPTYDQILRRYRTLQNNDTISNYNDAMIDCCLKLGCGPMDDTDVWNIIYVKVRLEKCIYDIVMKVKPYWYVGGNAGLIDRICEELDLRGHINAHAYALDFRLLFNGILLDREKQLADYKNLTSGYKIHSRSIENPYGYISLYSYRPNPIPEIIVE